MRAIRTFVTATLAGGFFVVLPVVLVAFVIDETLDLIVGLASPIADLVPGWSLADAEHPELQAGLILVLVSLVVGLAMRSTLGVRLGRAVERTVLDPIPGYSMMRGFTRRIAGAADEARFAPALLRMPLDGQAPALIVEELADGRAIVFLPTSPTPGVGTLQIVAADRLTRLDVPVGRFMDGLFHMGLGLGALTENREQR